MAQYQPSGKIRSWSVWYYDSGWVADGEIPRGGISEMVDVWGSTGQTLVLADGSQARTAPEHYHTREELTITIPAEQLTAAYNSKLKSYLASGAGIRIQTHESTSTYLEGYITSLRDTWKLSGKDQKHLFEINFLMFDVDGTGTI